MAVAGEGRLALGSTCVGDDGCKADWVVGGGGDSTGLCRLLVNGTQSLVVVLGRFSLGVGEKRLRPVLGPGGGAVRVVNDSSGSSDTAAAVDTPKAVVVDSLSLRVVATGPLVVTNDEEEEED